MNGISLSKLDCARRQLRASIILYFNRGDEVSIHTLASAALNILVDICKRREVKHALHIDTMIEQMIKPEHQQEVRRELRKFENFFKHADKDPEKSLAFYPEITEYWLFAAVDTYYVLTQERISAFRAFQLWFFMTHPNLLRTNPEEPLMEALKSFRLADHEREEYFRTAMAYLSRKG